MTYSVDVRFEFSLDLCPSFPDTPPHVSDPAPALTHVINYTPRVAVGAIKFTHLMRKAPRNVTHLQTCMSPNTKTYRQERSALSI